MREDQEEQTRALKSEAASTASRADPIVTKIVLWAAGLLVVVVALGVAAYWYSLSLGEGLHRSAGAANQGQEDLAQRLQRHVTAIASVPHNVSHPEELEKSAADIEAERKALGYTAAASG